jgi:hypothetical protein
MAKKQTALELAMKGQKVVTRPKAKILADLDDAIAWSETSGRELPIRVKRGRPSAEEKPRETRSVTVRFPAELAEQVETAADRRGVNLSEFIRWAALAASAPKKPASKVAASRPRRPVLRGR